MSPLHFKLLEDDVPGQRAADPRKCPSPAEVGLDVEILGLRGVGHLTPRLELRLVACTPAAGITTTLKVVQAELLWNDELLGIGMLLEESFSLHDAHRQVEFPTSRRLLQEITDGLGSSSNIGFVLRFTGSAEVIATGGTNFPRMVDDPLPEVPKTIRLSEQNTVNFSVSRTDWFEQVVSRLGDTDYVPLELLVPRAAVGDGWRKTLEHLKNAKRSYALGDDPSVFLHLRGAFDAVPGAKQHIFDAMPEPKRTEVNQLVNALGQFLHSGRHVSDTTGRFPVDHIDAGFALNLVDVLLSYASRALESEAAR